VIAPTSSDIGRRVIYRLPHASELNGTGKGGQGIEEGVITSFNSAYVFVRYRADSHSKATARCDLEWASTPTPGGLAEGGRS
jgi:hypothetical protein